MIIAQAEAFDWQTFLIGDASWLFILEVILRTGIIYLYAVVLISLLGKRSRDTLSPFDLILIIGLGSAVGDPMFYPEVGVLTAMMAITVVILIQWGLMELMDHVPALENFFETEPKCLVDDGRLQLEALEKEHLSRQELFVHLRENGIEHLGQVRRAYLEPSGRVSVFRFAPSRIRAGLSIMPDRTSKDPALRSGLPAPRRARYACLSCGETLFLNRTELFPACPRCEHDNWARAERGAKAKVKE